MTQTEDAASEDALARRSMAGPPGREPPSEVCVDIDMRIARDGTWHYLGTPIARPALVRLFATVLRRGAGGDFFLVTPVERVRIRVDDAPFTAVELAVTGAGQHQRLRFRLNIDVWIAADPDHPLRVVTDPVDQAPSPYLLVRDGLEALIARAVFYELAELAVEADVDGTAMLGVWSAGRFFPLGPAEIGE
ncbi:MAG: DUF1285 domain-containing protein [Alphaproteobacteria bacterium]|nr:DUF1285 domain-containing protein [Alphaproteobacteria bacterium]